VVARSGHRFGIDRRVYFKGFLYYAAAFVGEVLVAARSLDCYSTRGRVVPETGDDTIRELFVKGYRLLYKVGDDFVLILAVIHGRRDLGGIRR
jgi:plasmid stabilization system protein ParE